MRIFILLGMVFSAACVQAIPEKPLVIITTSYNNQKWAESNLTSIFSQKYSNYRLIYIDDCSADGTADQVERLVQSMNQTSRTTLIRNEVRKGTLANIFNAVHSCRDDEIVVSVDGDDWLANDTVLEKINRVYSKTDIWLTHGTLIEYPQNVVAWSIPIPGNIITSNSFRTFRCPTHLRTFYSWLFKKIKKEDLMYKGDFFQMTGDQAMMFPMIEMAGRRHAFIKDVIYVYNMENPINDNKVDPQLQKDLEVYIRSMPPYSPLKRGHK